MRKTTPIQRALSDFDEAARHLLQLVHHDASQLQTVPTGAVIAAHARGLGVSPDLNEWLQINSASLPISASTAHPTRHERA